MTRIEGWMLCDSFLKLIQCAKKATRLSIVQYSVVQCSADEEHNTQYFLVGRQHLSPRPYTVNGLRGTPPLYGKRSTGHPATPRLYTVKGLRGTR